MAVHIGHIPMTGTRLDPSATRRIQDVMDAHVDSGVLPSCSAALAVDGEVVWASTAGPVTTGTPYVLFSATKAVVAAAVWQLLDEGALALRQPVRDVLPGFGALGATPHRTGAVTVEHLLYHAAGFPTAHLSVADWESSPARQAAFAHWSCAFEPGTVFTYHPLSAHWVLAELIEVIDGKPFATSIHERVTAPLGLPQALAGPIASGPDVRQPVEVGEPPTNDEWRAVGLAEPIQDPPDLVQPIDVVGLLSRPDARRVGVPGGGGVLTPSDVALFYQALLHDPDDLWSTSILAEATARPRSDLVDLMSGMRANRTIGLIVAGDDGNAGFRGFGLRVESPRAFGHDGAGGQLAFADPDSGISFAFTTDGMDLQVIRQWKRSRKLADAALSALR